MKASRVILEALKREGVDTIFGFPGGQVIPLYDALYDFDINHILARHEQGAGHMRPTATPGLRARWGSAWPPPAPAPPT